MGQQRQGRRTLPASKHGCKQCRSLNVQQNAFANVLQFQEVRSTCLLDTRIATVPFGENADYKLSLQENSTGFLFNMADVAAGSNKQALKWIMIEMFFI